MKEIENNIASLVCTDIDKEFIVFRPKEQTGWSKITSTQFLHHVAAASRHWRHVFPEAQNHVVGIWLTGRKYSDFVNILGLISAGYIPELFSVVFANHEVIWDLLKKSTASALVYDEHFSKDVKQSPIPTFPSLPQQDLDSNDASSSLTVAPVDLQNTAFVVHSSGTTSGTPKLIPCSHGWLRAFVRLKFPAAVSQKPVAGDEGPDIMNTLGSLAHVGSFCALLAAIYHRFTTVQTSSMGFPTSELVDLAKTCGVNRFVLYAPFLSSHLSAAKEDSEVLRVLQNCRQVAYTGVALNKIDEAWGYDNNIPITSFYGCSETATLMTTTIGRSPSHHLFRLIPDVSADIIPAAQGQLLEVVVHAGNSESPHPSLCSPDGLFHTGDLFEEIEPGGYLYRGRSGDWIKTLGGFCDANAMEDEIRRCCGDIIYDVVIVGSSRPDPCMFAEVRSEIDATKEEELIQTIIERMAPYNERLFPYERIDDAKRIRLLAQGTLPRTKEKGNIRRNATEEAYDSVLDDIFR